MVTERPWEELQMTPPEYVTLMALGSGPRQPNFSAADGAGSAGSAGAGGSAGSAGSAGAGGGSGGGGSAAAALSAVPGLSAEEREEADAQIRLVAYYKYLGFKRQKGTMYVNDKSPGKEEGSYTYLQSSLATRNPYQPDNVLSSQFFSVPMTLAEVEAFFEAVYP